MENSPIIFEFSKKFGNIVYAIEWIQYVLWHIHVGLLVYLQYYKSNSINSNCVENKTTADAQETQKDTFTMDFHWNNTETILW